MRQPLSETLHHPTTGIQVGDTTIIRDAASLGLPWQADSDGNDYVCIVDSNGNYLFEGVMNDEEDKCRPDDIVEFAHIVVNMINEPIREENRLKQDVVKVLDIMYDMVGEFIIADDTAACSFCSKREWGPEKHDTSCPLTLAYSLNDRLEGMLNGL